MTGFYRGIVLKHLSAGRCKIYIPGVNPPEWNSYDKADNLPSAEQAAPICFGVNQGNGVFSYPNIGSAVWCFFQNGDQNMPVYFASSLGGKPASGNWDAARKMAGSHPDDAYVHKIHVKNSDIEIYETGQIKARTDFAGNFCQILMDADGNINLESSQTIKLKTKAIIFDAETQLDAKSPQMVVTAATAANVTSPSINLNSEEGHTKIKSRTNETFF